MKCPNCQRAHTLRRAEDETAFSVVCDVCGARFKILLNNAPDSNAAGRDDASSQRVPQPPRLEDLPLRSSLVPVPPRATSALVPPPVLAVAVPQSASTPRQESPTPNDVDKRLKYLEQLKRGKRQDREERPEREEYVERPTREENLETLADATLRQEKNFAAYRRQDISPRYLQGIGLYFLGVLLMLSAFTLTFSIGETFRICVRFIGLTLSAAVLVSLLTVFSKRFKVLDIPLNFIWSFLILPAPIIFATLAVVPAYNASKQSDKTVDASAPQNNAKTDAAQDAPTDSTDKTRLERR